MRPYQMALDMRPPRERWRPLAPADTKRILCQGHYRSPGCGSNATWCHEVNWNTGNTSGISFFYYCDDGRASFPDATESTPSNAQASVA